MTIAHVTNLEVLLFDDPSSVTPFKNTLKEFIYYLKFNHSKGLIDFSYAGFNHGLISNITLKDNIILDAVSTGLRKNKEETLRKKLTHLNNELFEKLISSLSPLERKVDDLTEAEKSLGSFTKAIISESNYIFLDGIEKDLSIKEITLIKEILTHEVIEHNRKVFLRPIHTETWVDLATEFIFKDKNNHYKKVKNKMCTLHKEKSKNLEKSTYQFTLMDKAV